MADSGPADNRVGEVAVDDRGLVWVAAASEAANHPRARHARVAAQPAYAVAGLVALAARAGAPTALRDVGLSEAQLDEAADLAAAKGPADNPRSATRDDVAALLYAAWHGPPIEVDEAAPSAAGTKGGG